MRVARCCPAELRVGVLAAVSVWRYFTYRFGVVGDNPEVLLAFNPAYAVAFLASAGGAYITYPAGTPST